MPKRRRVVTRRELLELVAATGALSLMSRSARADSGAPAAEPAFVPVGDIAELIGALLWASFAEGAKQGNISRDLNQKGHFLSEGPIRHHLKDCGGLEKFPLDKTMSCARAAGKKARDIQGGNLEITPDNFEEAWKYIHGQQVAALERLKKKNGKKQGADDCVYVLGGAC
jgi:hypothetical protein